MGSEERVRFIILGIALANLTDGALVKCVSLRLSEEILGGHRS